jgi:hypothetical protein
MDKPAEPILNHLSAVEDLATIHFSRVGSAGRKELLVHLEIVSNMPAAERY